MPYENDLTRFGEPIVEMLTRGTQNSEIAVVVQSDYWGDSQMRRRQLINGTATEVDVVLGEDSSDSSALAAYLDWANQTFEAEHWVVAVVGHGGRINYVSPDDHIITCQARTWMRVDQFADAVSNFNRSVNGRVELLFFQNCNKATLEVVYEVRNCAKYTLASQLNLGAPNYYYEGFLNHLASLVDGREAAITIMDSERADMFHTLTLVDNQSVESIPEKLSKLLQPILSNRLPSINQSELSTYRYFGEQHCDALALLGYVSRVSNQGQNEFAEFTDFLRSSVIKSYKIGGKLYGNPPPSNINSEELCGLSLYLPETEQDISRYSSLALYQGVDIVSLYKGIVTS
jgi:hypothetical protein